MGKSSREAQIKSLKNQYQTTLLFCGNLKKIAAILKTFTRTPDRIPLSDQDWADVGYWLQARQILPLYHKFEKSVCCQISQKCLEGR